MELKVTVERKILQRQVVSVNVDHAKDLTNAIDYKLYEADWEDIGICEVTHKIENICSEDKITSEAILKRRKGLLSKVKFDMQALDNVDGTARNIKIAYIVKEIENELQYK